MERLKKLINQKIYQTYNHDLNQGIFKKEKIKCCYYFIKRSKSKKLCFQIKLFKGKWWFV